MALRLPREAEDAGAKVLAYGCRVSPEEVRIAEEVSVRL
jgi:DNA-binding sugar fermentation-stimulating protein